MLPNAKRLPGEAFAISEDSRFYMARPRLNPVTSIHWKNDTYIGRPLPAVNSSVGESFANDPFLKWMLTKAKRLAGKVNNSPCRFQFDNVN
jgi:hypothetical protein